MKLNSFTIELLKHQIEFDKSYLKTIPKKSKEYEQIQNRIVLIKELLKKKQ